DLFEPALQVISVAEDPDEILHGLLKVAVDVVRTLARGVLEGREQLAFGLLDLSGVRRGVRAGAAGMARRGLSRAPSEDEQVREGVAAQAVCPVEPRRRLARGEEPRQCRLRGLGVYADASHHV